MPPCAPATAGRAWGCSSPRPMRSSCAKYRTTDKGGMKCDFPSFEHVQIGKAHLIRREHARTPLSRKDRAERTDLCNMVWVDTSTENTSWTRETHGLRNEVV